MLGIGWRVGCGLLTLLIVAVVVSALLLTRPHGQRNNRIENPPPMHPSCPPIPHLPLITRKDGKMADVRIVEVRGTKLFVPAQWLERYFVDLRRKEGWNTFDLLEQFSPDLHSNECPGVIHKLNLNGPTPKFGTNRGGVTAFTMSGNFGPVELSGTGGRRIGFSVDIQPTLNPDGVEKVTPRPRSVGDYWVRPNADFFILRSGPVREHARASNEAELRQLAQWLMEPPATRNNNQVFFASLPNQQTE